MNEVAGLVLDSTCDATVVVIMVMCDACRKRSQKWGIKWNAGSASPDEMHT